jgi:uncharacterized protein
MAGISVKLPLSLDSIDGAYRLTKTIKENIKQNFKNLILTSPGERIMDPLFGAGIRELFFEQNDQSSYNIISERIISQTEIYMPFLEIVDIQFSSIDAFEQPDNSLNISIEYRILPFDENDILNIIK